ncbi:TolA-binding protein [Micromonospora jinlongensis]|uniref:TolA-binding protein n=1 Tax=Micromonospora jinlongensis TaxID=1287877 RepID=A0A7Z0BF56_9ACTN|nr:TolA-binding protein [Micromonospora jinlongensis]
MAPARPPAARLAALIVAMFALGVALPAGTASAAPPTGLRAAAPDSDEEGGTPALRAQLEAASKGYLDAKRALDASVQRQQQLTTQLKTIEVELNQRSGKVGEIAGVAYRTGRLSAVSALLNSDSPEGFMDRAAALDAVAANEDRVLRDLLSSKDQANRTQVALNGEINEQRKQVAVMAKRKEQAERALTVATTPKPQAAADTGSNRGTSAANAKAAPRNSDGSWPSETCSVNDPTPANGCITPRTLHALNQAKAAGFTRYVSCHRPSGSGEHPKGRACDFAAQTGGFGGNATGGDKTYGNNLAAYFIRNADRLAVLYVIWYRQIWLPSSGWKSYSGAGGTPSTDHTNHVHLSVY